MTNKLQRILRCVTGTMLRHPDVQIWTFNGVDAIYVTQWDGKKQINYSFYEWHEDAIINTQLDNLEQMCWLIMNRTPRRDSDDEDINYSTERTQDNGIQS